MADDGFARAQAQYEARVPDEPEIAEDWLLAATLAFRLNLANCTFSADQEVARREAREYANETSGAGLLARVRTALEREFRGEVGWIEVDEVELGSAAQAQNGEPS
jgi:hypothetical protein